MWRREVNYILSEKLHSMGQPCSSGKHASSALSFRSLVWGNFPWVGCTNMLLCCWNVVGLGKLHFLVLEGINKLEQSILCVTVLCIIAATYLQQRTGLFWCMYFMCSWKGTALLRVSHGPYYIHICIRNGVRINNDADQLHLKWSLWSGVVGAELFVDSCKNHQSWKGVTRLLLRWCVQAAEYQSILKTNDFSSGSFPLSLGGGVAGEALQFTCRRDAAMCLVAISSDLTKQLFQLNKFVITRLLDYEQRIKSDKTVRKTLLLSLKV